MKINRQLSESSDNQVSVAYRHSENLGVKIHHSCKSYASKTFWAAIEFPDGKVMHVDMRMIDGRTSLPDSTMDISRQIETIGPHKRLRVFEEMLNKYFVSQSDLLRHAILRNSLIQ